MSKKNLNADGLLNELKGNSSFFPERKHEPTQQEQASLSSPLPTQIMEPTENEMHGEVSKQSSLQASNDASKHASTLAFPQEIIETIRKIVKSPAKEEVLYVRVTKEEKNQLGEIEYTYQRQNIETSANELGRIAVNFLIADYKANGENSILAQVLAALNA